MLNGSTLGITSTEKNASILGETQILCSGVRKQIAKKPRKSGLKRHFIVYYQVLRLDGGEGEIRTHGELTPTLVFKTRAINHSATSPHDWFIYRF